MKTNGKNAERDTSLCEVSLVKTIPFWLSYKRTWQQAFILAVYRCVYLLCFFQISSASQTKYRNT